jgi:hypothetical protein
MTRNEELVARERAKWVRICRERAALWRRTQMNVQGPPAAREEARARANEADFIADLIAAGDAGADVVH